MLRLDPAYPPVWRSPTALQFGAEAVARIDDPEPWQLRVVRELERGIPDTAFVPLAEAFGAPAADDAVRLLSRLRRALTAPDEVRASAEVVLCDPVPDAQRHAVAAGLAAAGLDVVASDGAHSSDASDAAPTVVVLAHRLVLPAAVAPLMADDVPHLPVVLTGSGADIGPLVVPGVTACLSCVAARRRDEDPAWPLVMSQLLGRPVSPDPGLTWESGLVAGRLISERSRRPESLRAPSVTLRAGSLHRSVKQHHPHAECRCRSLAGTGRAAAPAFLETTSVPAFARPA